MLSLFGNSPLLVGLPEAQALRQPLPSPCYADCSAYHMFWTLHRGAADIALAQMEDAHAAECMA